MYRASIQMRHSKIILIKRNWPIGWLNGYKNPPKTYSFCNQVRSLHQTFLSKHKKEGDVRGIWIPQNHTEIRKNTAQNNVRKPPWNYPKISKYHKPLGFVKLQYGNLIKINIPRKPHQKLSNTASPQTLTPRSKCVTGGWHHGSWMMEIYMLTNSQLICCLFTKPTGREHCVKKYGNEICLFDATYKTSWYALC